jgi:hypothetical protein
MYAQSGKLELAQAQVLTDSGSVRELIVEPTLRTHPEIELISNIRDCIPCDFGLRSKEVRNVGLNGIRGVMPEQFEVVEVLHSRQDLVKKFRQRRRDA